MKATGIVRRIDNLGRIVIPKEVRKILNLDNNDPVEIFLDRDEGVVLKKYSPIKELTPFAQDYVNALYNRLGRRIIISDKDAFIAESEAQSEGAYVSKRIGSLLQSAIDQRETLTIFEQGEYNLVSDYQEPMAGYMITPIKTSEETIGAIVMIADEPMSDPDSHTAQMLLETGADFLAKQMA